MSSTFDESNYITYVDASTHTFYNFNELMTSRKIGCYCCGKIFRKHHIDATHHCCAFNLDGTCDSTVYCPFCFNNTLIGDASGYKVSPEFLTYMNICEFGKDNSQ